MSGERAGGRARSSMEEDRGCTFEQELENEELASRKCLGDGLPCWTRWRGRLRGRAQGVHTSYSSLAMAEEWVGVGGWVGGWM